MMGDTVSDGGVDTGFGQEESAHGCQSSNE